MDFHYFFFIDTLRDGVGRGGRMVESENGRRYGEEQNRAGESIRCKNIISNVGISEWEDANKKIKRNFYPSSLKQGSLKIVCLCMGCVCVK